MAGFGVPSDVYARYERMKGNEVLMVSGTDEQRGLQDGLGKDQRQQAGGNAQVGGRISVPLTVDARHERVGDEIEHQRERQADAGRKQGDADVMVAVDEARLEERLGAHHHGQHGGKGKGRFQQRHGGGVL
ncbi:MAG: class I tRNA ligase family protein [Lautropia mirabilis]